jgi:acetyl-CoA acetyltransferase
MSKTVDPVEKRFGATMPALIALLSQGFFQRHGIRGERVADVLSRLMFRAHALGSDNPLAAFAGKPESLAAYFDESKNLPVATPLRRKDCSPICDGAAALILTSRPQARGLAPAGGRTAWPGHRLAAGDRRAAAFAKYHGDPRPARAVGAWCSAARCGLRQNRSIRHLRGRGARR